MFTGIVSHKAEIVDIETGKDSLRISVQDPFGDLVLGESVAVNGACLTVVELSDSMFSVDAVVTTRGRTTVSDWKVGAEVNLERSLEVGDRFGGHIVQGHVDGVGVVANLTRREDAVLFDVSIPEEVWKTTIAHGSITLDGVSLTVNELLSENTVQVSIIPYTLEHTILGAWEVGSRVHVEGDLFGKYVRRIQETSDGSSS